MVGIGIAYRHDYLARLDVKLAIHERLVHPELLDIHLTALLYFRLVFAGFLGFYLHGSTIAAMLKLNLRTHRPSLAEIITDVQTHMGQVEAPVTLVVGIVLRLLVAIKTLTVEVARHHGLAISTDVKTRLGQHTKGQHEGYYH